MPDGEPGGGVATGCPPSATSFAESPARRNQLLIFSNVIARGAYRGRTDNGHAQYGGADSWHTLTSDAEGNVYVTEWLLGGPLTRLARR
jgi:hypothetical protein